MKNRISSSPILTAVVLSLFQLSSSAQSTAPVSNTPVATPAPAATTVVSSTPAPLPPNTASYTVVKGDSLTKIAEKLNTTRKKLEALNNLATSKVTPGQVILVPSHKKSTSVASTAKTPAKAHHNYPAAQPVQDFDIPASTFASCPVPMPSEQNDVPPPAPAKEKPAPIAQLVSPSELAADMARMQAENDALAAAKHHAASPQILSPQVTPIAPTPKKNDASSAQRFANSPTAPSQQPSPTSSASPIHSTNRGTPVTAATATAANDWASRFLQQARLLGNQGIEYDDDWRPPGESRSWTMDCSNTARYLYKVTAGIELPRTASDQYYYLHLQGKAWDVPQNSMGLADGKYLRENLKPGDLLFWENTYRPERQPPITHVMVFLGTNAQGEWIMAGSQSSRGGEHNRRNGGPDIYVFRPSQPCGGYTTWMGMVHHKGRFCAFGRPLEADRSKLAVAQN